MIKSIEEFTEAELIAKIHLMNRNRKLLEEELSDYKLQCIKFEKEIEELNMQLQRCDDEITKHFKTIDAHYDDIKHLDGVVVMLKELIKHGLKH